MQNKDEYMQNFEIKTDCLGKELIEHGDIMFSLAGYDEYFSKFILKEVPWHWHDEIEIIVVLEGATKIEYINGSIDINEGECIFINCNVLHRLTQISKKDCHIINFVFKPNFLSGRVDNRISTKFISPICSNQNIDIIKFSPNIKWQKQFIFDISEAFKYYKEKLFGYEILVKSKLLGAWYILIANNRNILKNDTIYSQNNIRLNDIIKFIHKNYNLKLSTKDLAKVANISESECYRLFNKILKTTPNKYILKHRLQLGALRLVQTDDSILEISLDLGFKSPSYFSKQFKLLYNQTPKVFRNKNR